MAAVKKQSAAGQVHQAMKLPKENTALKAFDHASSEIQVIQAEMQKYMIQIAFDMFEKETNALTKTFEMSSLRISAFINPA